jgi:tetratricopeptide repeat protein
LPFGACGFDSRPRYSSLRSRRNTEFSRRGRRSVGLIPRFGRIFPAEVHTIPRAINQDHIATLPDRTEPNLEVGCVTCHGGRTRPTTLVQEMTWAVEVGGVDAMTARYAELRERYFGRGTLDFGDATLATVAQTLGRLDPEVGMAAIELNLEHYPESVSSWILKGQLHLRSEQAAEAIAAFERALELAPGNARIERLLEQARAG